MWKMLILPGAFLFGLPLPAAGTAYRSYLERVAEVRRISGLVAFWDFVQREDGLHGSGRFVSATGRAAPAFPLELRNIARDYWGEGRAAGWDDFPLLGRGPFGQAVRFTPLTAADLRPVLLVPREQIHDTGLDVKGPGRSVSMVAWVIREGGSHAIAGIWHEGTDISPDSDRPAAVEKGRRQYALFAGLAGNPGAVSVHLSENGAASFGDRYARNMAVTAEKMPAAGPGSTAGQLDAAWTVAGFTFDNARNRATAYIDGKCSTYWIDDPARHPFYRFVHRGWLQAHLARTPGLQPGEDPLFPRDQFYTPPESKPRRERVISQTPEERVVERTYEYTVVRVTLRKDTAGRFTVPAARELTRLCVNPFWFEHDLYAPPSAAEGGPFTIGRVIHSLRGAGMDGYIGGVAVFNRALTRREMARLAAVGRRKSAHGSRLELLELSRILETAPGKQ